MTDLEVDASNAKQLKKAKELIDAKLEQIDPDSTEKDEEIENLRIERDDLAAKLETIAEIQFNKAREKLGAPTEIDSPEKLEAWKLVKSGNHQNPEVTTGGGASGKALLREPSSSSVKEYGSFGEMYQDLQQRANSDNEAVREEAEQILGKLHEKMLKSDHKFEVELDIGKYAKDLNEKNRKNAQDILKNSRGN